jgi:hypothetical protein
MKLNENCFISTSRFVLIQGYEIAFTYWICGDIKIIGKIPKITYNVKELGVKVFLQFSLVSVWDSLIGLQLPLVCLFFVKEMII